MNYTPNEPPRAMSAAEIEKILPHRYPFALVDKILDYTPGQWARGVKCVTRTEPFFFEGALSGTPRYARCADSGSAGPDRGGSRVKPAGKNRGKLALFGGVKKRPFPPAGHTRRCVDIGM